MFKILIYELSLAHQLKNIFLRYNVDVVSDDEAFINATYEKNYHLYILNFYSHSLIEELKESKDITTTILVDEFYNIHNIKKTFLIADDYMVKPLFLEELEIRVDYHYRKLFNNIKNIIIYKEFYFHVDSEQLFRKTNKVKLTPNEMKLVKLFLVHINKPISKDIIYDELQSSSDGSLRVYISKLNKLGFDISYDRAIVSYMLNTTTMI